MAKAPRNPLAPQGVKQHNAEAREAAGLRDKLLTNLQPEELQELAATWMLEGYDALRTKYGLSRGEVITLLSMPSWLSIVKVAASNVRASVVLRAMGSVSRIMQILETKVEQNGSVADTVEALNLVKDVFLEISGMAAPATQQGSVEPSVMAEDEQAALSQLNTHLQALTDARLVGETPKEKERA